MKRPAQLGDHPRPVALTGDSTAGRFPRGQTAGEAVGLDAMLPEKPGSGLSASLFDKRRRRVDLSEVV
ncbi:MAG: hypothetical protein VXX04_06345 [Actinomycetota bacterium]|nr:hypothetical protein [Actinomycetota bacterium]